MKSKVVIILTAIIYVFIITNKSIWRENKGIEWDKSGYYLYLPAIFIYNDLGKFDFYPRINEKYNLTPGAPLYSLHDQPATGRRVNKYPVGVSIIELPFFLIAHAFTSITRDHEADGYTAYYLLLMILANVSVVLSGLLLLRITLLRFFEDKIVAVTLVLIAFGTNLYNYTVFDHGMAHPYVFFMFAGLLNFTDLFYRKAWARDAVLAGVFLGLVTITRPTDLLILPVLFLWGNSFGQQPSRLKFFGANIGKIALAVLFFFLVVMIQLGYWKYATGSWIHFSYEDEGFNFADPQIWKGLFSYRKGWFVYTPLALVATAGIISIFRKYRAMSLGIVIFLAINIYVVFSWHQWYYGGGFGSRPMIETYAVLAFPLAGLLEWILRRRQKAIRIFSVTILTLVLVLNIFQTYQYSLGVIPWDHTNKKYYWEVFLQLETTEDQWQLLDFDEKA